MMSPLIDRPAMESVFGADGLVTFPDETLVGIPHPPTRAYLRETGLPEREQWFFTFQEVAEGDLTVVGPGRQAEQGYADCPYDMSSWLPLGGIAMDNVSVDTVTGIVYCVPEGRSVHVLNSSVDALGFFLHALEKERHAYDPDMDDESGLDTTGAEERLRALMHRTDPAALQNPDSSWHMVLHYVGNGLMFY